MSLLHFPIDRTSFEKLSRRKHLIDNFGVWHDLVYTLYAGYTECMGPHECNVALGCMCTCYHKRARPTWDISIINRWANSACVRVCLCTCIARRADRCVRLSLSHTQCLFLPLSLYGTIAYRSREITYSNFTREHPDAISLPITHLARFIYNKSLREKADKWIMREIAFYTRNVCTKV